MYVLESRNSYDAVNLINELLDKFGASYFSNSITNMLLYLEDYLEYPEADYLIGRVYMYEGEYDIAGFAVGIVDKDKIINGKNIKPGDKLIGIASSGVHSNGFSLVRKLYTDLNEKFNGEEVWKTLITPTKIYVKPILSLIEKFDIKGMSHITGGGFIENVPRMFNGSELTAEINKDSYPLPAIFEDMINKGVNRDHMYNTFNMGIGFVLCVDEKDVNAVIKELHELGEKAYEIGVVTAGGEGVCLK